MGNPTNNTNDTNRLRVMLEIGPRGKKLVAVAPDWPGLERGATTEEAAIERLLSYVLRYAPVARLAWMEAEFATNTLSIQIGPGWRHFELAGRGVR